MAQAYTIGHEESYDDALQGAETLYKRGRSEDGSYAGGYVFGSIPEAIAKIHELDKIGEWAVYEIEVDWDSVTKHPTGDYLVCTEESRIIKKARGQVV